MKKKVMYKKEMKQEISYLVTSIGDVPEHQLTNFVRISSVNFSDPDFGPSEQLDYGQSDHIKGNGSHSVNDRPNGATHVRRNGATLKWQNWGSRRAFKLAFFTPFRNNIFYGFCAA